MTHKSHKPTYLIVIIGPYHIISPATVLLLCWPTNLNRTIRNNASQGTRRGDSHNKWFYSHVFCKYVLVGWIVQFDTSL